jgi:phage tail sheath protein FI
MTQYRTPGVYVEVVPAGPRPIEAVGTSTAAFVGTVPDPDAAVNVPQAVNNWTEFVRRFVPAAPAGERAAANVLASAVYGFFDNGGSRCYVVNVPADGEVADALAALRSYDEVAIVAAPGRADAASYEALLSHCEQLTDRVAILDAPEQVDDIEALTTVATATSARRRGSGAASTGLRPRQSDNGFGTFYFPWITVLDPLSNALVDVPPSGHMAGIWARTDAGRGVHKAPANEPVRGALNLTYRLSIEEQGLLNDAGVNGLRIFAREGIRVWGARTLAPAASEWRYLSVRRLFNMAAESIAEGTSWVVFEPNDRTLWKHIRRDVGAFLTRMWRDGALMGSTPEEAFFVKCDEETNPPDSVEAGQLVAVIGMAPVRPAEFIVFRLSQSTAGTEITSGSSISG